MTRKLFSVVIFSLLFPYLAFATLSSSNYTVINNAVSGWGQSGNASSTNYDWDLQTGYLYFYDDPNFVEDDNNSGGTVTTPPPPPPPPPDPDPDPGENPGGDPSVNPAPTSGGSGGSSGGSSSGSGTRVEQPNLTVSTTPAINETPPAPPVENQIPALETESAIPNETFSSPATAIEKAIVENILPVLESVAELVEPLKQEEPRPVSTDVVGVSSAAVVTWFSLARMPFSLSNLGSIFTHGWANILGLFAIKRRRPWGTVYDSMTKAPLDPVYVEIYDQQGKKRGEAITDLDGRYGFLVPEGIYTIKAKKNNYIFPSKHLHVTGEDTIYRNLYFGEQVHITDTAAFDIPMDPIKFDWNQYEKLRTKQTYFFHRLDPILSYVMRVLFYLSIGLTIWQYYSLRDVYSLVLLVFYIILLVIYHTHSKPPLFGSIKKHGYVLPYAIIKIKYGSTVFAKKVTDQYGRYVAIVPNGTYTLEIDERISEREYKTIATREMTVKKGVINEHIEL